LNGPGFPDGSVVLAGGRRFDYARERGDAVFAASGGDVFRIAIATGAAETLATFPGEATRGLVATAQHVVVQVFPLDPSYASGVVVKSVGRLVAIPVGGGAPFDVLSPLPISSIVAAAAGAVFVTPDRPEVLRFDGPRLARSESWPAVDKNAIVYDLVPLREGAAWVERDAAGSPPTPTVVAATRGSAPRALASLLSEGITADDRTVYSWWIDPPPDDSRRAAPRFSRKAQVVALDGATSARRVLARGLDNPMSLLAGGGGDLCATIAGADFESTAVVAIPMSDGPVRTIATLPHGLNVARCIGVDAASFTVILGFPGAVARIPARGP
jgi:hypothetical protein